MFDPIELGIEFFEGLTAIDKAIVEQAAEEPCRDCGGPLYRGDYPNRQDAATLWYHDHAMGIERLNHYAGLFGVFLIRDDAEEALDLPRGAHEIPLVLCDRMFDAAGQLRYPVADVAGAPWVEDVRGDVHLVNGKIFPFLEVEPTRYRFRLVNASNGRSYSLTIVGGPAIVPDRD